MSDRPLVERLREFADGWLALPFTQSSRAKALLREAAAALELQHETDMLLAERTAALEAATTEPEREPDAVPDGAAASSGTSGSVAAVDAHAALIGAFVSRAHLRRFSLGGEDVTDADVLAALDALVAALRATQGELDNAAGVLGERAQHVAELEQERAALEMKFENANGSRLFLQSKADAAVADNARLRAALQPFAAPFFMAQRADIDRARAALAGSAGSPPPPEPEEAHRAKERPECAPTAVVVLADGDDLHAPGPCALCGRDPAAEAKSLGESVSRADEEPPGSGAARGQGRPADSPSSMDAARVAGLEAALREKAQDARQIEATALRSTQRQFYKGRRIALLEAAIALAGLREAPPEEKA